MLFRNLRSHTGSPVPALGLMLGILACVQPADAAIVELTRDAFADAMVGELSFVDDFESYAVGPRAGQMFFSNGVLFDNPAPIVTSSGVSGQAVIGNNLPLTEPRRFANFAADATLVGFALLLDEDDEFDVTVQTLTGEVLFIEARRGRDFEGFFGVRITNDSIGSLSFATIGGSTGAGTGGSSVSNFAFDDFTVNAVAPVPLPPSLGLALTALAACASRARRAV